MDIEKLIQDIVDEVKNVSGVKAIVLGGSRARGMHHAASDVDLGIYYDSSQPLDVNELAKVAAKLDDEHRTDRHYSNRRVGTVDQWRRLASYSIRPRRFSI